MTELSERQDRVNILEDEVNRYIDRVDKVPLYPLDRYRLIHHCLRHLDILGYRYDINSKHKLVITNYYRDLDINSVSKLIEDNYRELSEAANDIAMYDNDRQNILFLFREIIFRFGIKATYHLGSGKLALLENN